VTPGRVCKWRSRFVRQRLDGLYDEPRPGALRTIADEQLEQVIIRTLETTPPGATRWSTRDMANGRGSEPHGHLSDSAHLRLSAASERDIQLSNNLLLIEKVREIVGLYLNPPADAAVFRVDDKPQLQALDRTQPLLPLQPGQVERRPHDYKRYGTTTLSAALNAKTSEVITSVCGNSKLPFRTFIDPHQANPKPFVWTKIPDEILASIVRFAQRTAGVRAPQLLSRATVNGH